LAIGKKLGAASIFDLKFNEALRGTRMPIQRPQSLSRPLSPFWIYRRQYTMVLSILHRITGVFMTFGMALLAYWLVAAASGRQQYAEAQANFKSPLLQAALFAWLFCFFYHFANGLRHLTWDTGHGFDLKVARASGWAVAIISILLTIGCWFLFSARLSGGVL
jgi:succinate dehydrogenase / fumarate reductase cytochrome b subunit